MTTPAEAKAWLAKRVNLETRVTAPPGPRRPSRRLDAPTLDRMRAIVGLLGSPQLQYPSIHITGTNGKTTTTRIASRLLMAVGLSVGMVPLVAEELVERHQRWRDMVEHLGTVSTQSFQVWLRDDQRALGWRGPERVTVSGYVEPFDTWASMGHLIDREDWPLAGRPGAIAYFCNTMGGRAVTDLIEAAAHDQEVADRAVTFLRRDLPALLPGARDPAIRHALTLGQEVAIDPPRP